MSGEVTLVAPAGASVGEPRANTRNLQIDVARGFAIVLVVLGHNRAISRWWPDLVAAIFLFHVPLFFLLSGWVMRREPVLKATGVLTRRLLVPCFVAALIVGAVKCVTRDESVAQTAFGIVWATGQTLPWSHLWFLPALFLALLATQILWEIIGDRALQWFVATGVLAVLAALVSPPSPLGLPWSLDLLPLCLVFVWLGRTLRQSPGLMSLLLMPGTWFIAALSFAALLGVAHVDLNMRVFTPYFLALTAAVCGCVLTLGVAALSSRFPACANLFSFLGRHTLAIFILHVSIQKAMLATFDRWVSIPANASWVPGLITSAAAIAAAVAIDRYVFERVGMLRFLFLRRRAS